MDLKRDKRQNIQKKLDFSSEPTGEARQARREETESRQVMHEPESPANTTRLMEEVCERENLEAGRRRDAKTRYPNYARSISPASGDAGSAAAVEPNVLRSQLRFSTGTICTSSSNPSTAVPYGGLRLGDRSRLGEIFRSSQSRQIDGADRETCRG